MGKKGRRTGTCVFCGTYGRLTREDATPKWLGRFINENLPPKGRWEAVQTRFGDDTTPSQRSTFAGSASPHKPIVVCSTCNNGWMSGLETEACQILKPLILGAPVYLDQRSTLILATWATKTALVYEFVMRERDGTTASATDRRSFRDNRHPLPDSRIWLARYVGTQGTVIIARSTLFLYNLDDQTPSPEAHGLFVVLTYGQLALRVALLRSNPTYPTNLALWEGSQTRTLWPYQAPALWPPNDGLDDEAMQLFMSVRLPESGSDSITHRGRPPFA